MLVERQQKASGKGVGSNSRFYEEKEIIKYPTDPVAPVITTTLPSIETSVSI
jgi:hypothetical protein